LGTGGHAFTASEGNEWIGYIFGTAGVVLSVSGQSTTILQLTVFVRAASAGARVAEMTENVEAKLNA